MRTLFVVVLLLTVACGGAGSRSAPPAPGVTSAPVSTNAPAPGDLPTAEQLCDLLTADDWGEFSYVTAATPSIASDGPGNAYCVYAGTSGATDGLELDAFVDATAEDAQATLETITSEGPAMSPTDLANADVALIGTGGDYAAIAVRNGRFTFTIALPSNEEADVQLKTLASSVIARSAAYR